MNCCASANTGTSWLLTHKAKGKVARHKTRIETETRIENGEQAPKDPAGTWIPAFLPLREVPRGVGATARATWYSTKLPSASSARLKARRRWIDRTARLLGINRDSYITDTYAALFYAWKRRTRSRANEMTFGAIQKAKAPD